MTTDVVVDVGITCTNGETVDNQLDTLTSVNGETHHASILYIMVFR